MNKEKVIDLTGEKSSSVKLKLPKNANVVLVDDGAVMIEINNDPFDLVPKSWEEFCKKHPSVVGDYYDNYSVISMLGAEYVEGRNKSEDKCLYANIEDAKAFIALKQLRRLWIDWIEVLGRNTLEKCFSIYYSPGADEIYIRKDFGPFSFLEKEHAKEFVKCFGDLLEEAKILL